MWVTLEANLVQCGTIWYNMVQSVWCILVQSGTFWYILVHSGTIQDTLDTNLVQFCTFWYNLGHSGRPSRAIGFNLVQSGTIYFNLVQSGTFWYIPNTLWYILVQSSVLVQSRTYARFSLEFPHIIHYIAQCNLIQFKKNLVGSPPHQKKCCFQQIPCS